MSQVTAHPTTIRTEKRVLRVPARRSLRLPKIPFWLGALVFTIAGSVLMVLASR